MLSSCMPAYLPMFIVYASTPVDATADVSRFFVHLLFYVNKDMRWDECTKHLLSVGATTKRDSTLAEICTS